MASFCYRFEQVVTNTELLAANDTTEGVSFLGFMVVKQSHYLGLQFLEQG